MLFSQHLLPVCSTEVPLNTYYTYLQLIYNWAQWDKQQMLADTIFKLPIRTGCRIIYLNGTPWRSAMMPPDDLTAHTNSKRHLLNWRALSVLLCLHCPNPSHQAAHSPCSFAGEAVKSLNRLLSDTRASTDDMPGPPPHHHQLLLQCR